MTQAVESTSMDCKHLLVLVLVTFIYLIIGMLAFRRLELDAEKTRRIKLQEEIMEFMVNHTCIGMEDLATLLDILDDRTHEAKGVVTNQTHRYVWDYSGSLSFVTTIVTTIGYGHMTPNTGTSKLLSVIYALIGIPLTLLMLKDIGEKLHCTAQRLYQVRYCRWAWLNKTVNVAVVILMGVNAVMILPSLLFVHIEDWTMVEALYYCFITLSTIGFGDYLPLGRRLMDTPYRTVYTIFIYIWIFFGLAHVSLLIASISNSIVKKVNSVEKHTLTKLEAEMKRLRHQTMRCKHKTHDITTDKVEGGAPTTSLDVKLLNYHTMKGDDSQSNLGTKDNANGKDLKQPS